LRGPHLGLTHHYAPPPFRASAAAISAQIRSRSARAQAAKRAASGLPSRSAMVANTRDLKSKNSARCWGVVRGLSYSARKARTSAGPDSADRSEGLSDILGAPLLRFRSRGRGSRGGQVLAHQAAPSCVS